MAKFKATHAVNPYCKWDAHISNATDTTNKDQLTKTPIESCISFKLDFYC